VVTPAGVEALRQSAAAVDSELEAPPPAERGTKLGRDTTRHDTPSHNHEPDN
jgi:hypothetical protein